MHHDLFQDKVLAFVVFFSLSQAVYADVYLQMQGGIGGLYTKSYSANSDPYNRVSLRNGAAYRVSGGYLFAKNTWQYGIELGYAGYPNNTYAFAFPSLSAAGIQKYKSEYMDVLGVMHYSLKRLLNHEFYLVAKAGMARVKQTFQGESSALGTLFALNQTLCRYKLEAVIGAGYQVNKAISMDLSYQRIFAGQANPFSDLSAEQNSLTRVSAVSTVMLGISYHFL